MSLPDHFYEEVHGWFDFHRFYNMVIDDCTAKKIHRPVFVEVGVYYGRSIFYLTVEALRRELFPAVYAVDHFIWPADVLEKFEAKRREKNLDWQIATIKSPSHEGGKTFQDGSCDLVFIDADHTYPFVYRDLRAWYWKVKDGGFFGGHDYDPEFEGVIRAVNEFMKDIGREKDLQVEGRTWWLRK